MSNTPGLPVPDDDSDSLSLTGNTSAPIDATDEAAIKQARPLDRLEFNQSAPHHWWQRRDHLLRVGLVSFTVLAFSLSGMAALRYSSAESSVANSGFGITRLPLQSLRSGATQQAVSPTLTVNGRLQVSDTMLLTAITQPGKPVAGQLYYDKTTNALAFYNGQRYVNLSAGNNTSTAVTASPTIINNITNISQTAPAATPPASVLLQAATPGTQQNGSFSVSGTGIIGAVQTQIINSNGGSLFINPLSATTGGTVIPGGPAVAGYNGTGNIGGGGEQNTFIATKIVTGSQGGTANSISTRIHSGDSSRHIVMALYDDDGNLPSRPGNLLASTAIVNVVPDSVNTVTIPSVTLTANTTYWLAFNTDDPTASREGISGFQQECFWVPGFAMPGNPFAPFGCFYNGNSAVIWMNYTTAPTTSGGGSDRAAAIIDGQGLTTFRNFSDSTSAFQIQNSGGTSTVFSVDTVNGRIGIGKSTPAYRLDISGGDINMSNGRSLRFAGNVALNVSGSGGITTLGNFASGGTVNIQGDNFTVRDAANSHSAMIIDNNGSAIFRNHTNNTAAFLIQNAAATTTYFKVDAVNGRVGINNSSPQYALDVNGNLNLSSGSAFKIDGVDVCTASGCTAAAGSGNYIQSTTTEQSGANFNISGNGTIGTTLNVNGAAELNGHVAIGANSTVNSGSLLYPGSTFSTQLSIQETRTAMSATDYVEGITNYLNLNPSANGTAWTYGIDNEVHIQSGNTRNLPAVIGAYNEVRHRGSGTISTVSGSQNFISSTSSGTLTIAKAVEAGVTNSSTGTITDAMGVRAYFNNTGAGTITNGYGIYIDSAANSGGGTVVNNYGLFLEDQSGVGSTNSYNIYSAGSTAMNYFDGIVGIGAINASYKLNVAGDINTSGNLRFTLHLVSGGSTPAIAAGVAACTTPTVSVTGTDTAGLITVTTGTGCASTGALASLTFATAFGAAPRVVLTSGDANATGLAYYYDATTISTTAFSLMTNTVPTDATTYRYSYQIIQ